MAPGHGTAMMILPWLPHAQQPVVVTRPLLRMIQLLTGMGAATVPALLSPTPALMERLAWLSVMQQPLLGYPLPFLIVHLGAATLPRLLFRFQPLFLPLFLHLFLPLFQPLFLPLFQPLFLPLFHHLFHPQYQPQKIVVRRTR